MNKGIIAPDRDCQHVLQPLETNNVHMKCRDAQATLIPHVGIMAA